MSNVYLHSKTNNNSLIKVVLILLIPFMFYGIYKNCLCLLDDYRALIYLKPFIFIGISLIITLIIKIIYKEKFISNNLLENLIIAMIVMPNTNIIVYSVLIIIPKEEQKSYPCNRCGLCYKVCPVRVNPKKVMDSKKVSKNCIDCGICSYICPCHINLRKYFWGEHE